MDRHRGVAPPRHALRPTTADAYAFETGQPAVSEGVTLTAVALLVAVVRWLHRREARDLRRSRPLIRNDRRR